MDCKSPKRVRAATGERLPGLCSVNTMRISILDQSPIISGHSPADAVRETVRLAQAADELGYHRYWLAEHHNMHGLADPCPEILLAAIGSATSRIRIGTRLVSFFLETQYKYRYSKFLASTSIRS